MGLRLVSRPQGAVCLAGLQPQPQTVEWAGRRCSALGEGCGCSRAEGAEEGRRKAGGAPLRRAAGLLSSDVASRGGFLEGAGPLMGMRGG